MSQFAEDVRLLGELNGLIERAQRQAAPPEFAGAVLGAIGIYEPIMEYAGAGASVPLLGFGNLLWKPSGRWTSSPGQKPGSSNFWRR